MWWTALPPTRPRGIPGLSQQTRGGLWKTDKVTTIGPDLARTVLVASGASSIQVHGIEESGRTVVQRRLRRSEVLVFFRKPVPRLVDMEPSLTHAPDAVAEIERLHPYDCPRILTDSVEANPAYADWVATQTRAG